MTKAEIKYTQARVGTLPDGFWGAKSTAACKLYLTRMARRGRFPTQHQLQSGKSVYGPHGVKGGYTPPMKKIRLPFQMYLYGDASKPVHYISFHEVCAEAFEEALVNMREVYPNEADRKRAGILDYYGVYNPRKMRGGSLWSTHSWACAIDLDANRNKNRSHWPVASKMPIEVMECYVKAGILPAGPFWSRDAMHAQATAI